MTVILAISAIPLGIGWIWTMPLFYNAIGVLYEEEFSGGALESA